MFLEILPGQWQVSIFLILRIFFQNVLGLGLCEWWEKLLPLWSFLSMATLVMQFFMSDIKLFQTWYWQLVYLWVPCNTPNPSLSHLNVMLNACFLQSPDSLTQWTQICGCQHLPEGRWGEIQQRRKCQSIESIHTKLKRVHRAVFLLKNEISLAP